MFPHRSPQRLLIAGAIFAAILFATNGQALDPIPTGAQNAQGYPAWWFQRGVIQRLQPVNPNPAWPAD